MKKEFVGFFYFGFLNDKYKKLFFSYVKGG